MITRSDVQRETETSSRDRRCLFRKSREPTPASLGRPIAARQERHPVVADLTGHDSSRLAPQEVVNRIGIGLAAHTQSHHHLLGHAWQPELDELILAVRARPKTARL